MGIKSYLRQNGDSLIPDTNDKEKKPVSEKKTLPIQIKEDVDLQTLAENPAVDAQQIYDDIDNQNQSVTEDKSQEFPEEKIEDQPEPEREAEIREDFAPIFLEEPRELTDKNDIKGPLGLDIGTTGIVLAYKNKKEVRISRQLNAFFTLPYLQLTKEALIKDGIMFFQKDSLLYVLSHPAEDFANIFGRNTRRPIERGMLNPKEYESESVIKAIVNQVVPRAKKHGEKICFSVPGDPLDNPESSLVYHQSIIKLHLTGLDYSPVPINEGLSVVLAELSDSNYTGLGISLGGGMCNVCFSYLTVPVVLYSIQKGGDYIDSMVSQSVGESVASVRDIKEKSLDLSISPRDKIENGLHIYYDELFMTLAKSIQQVLGKSENIPRLSKPIPVVLGGGTSMPRGSREKFEKALKGVPLPIQISEVVLSKDPLHSTAKGALMMALLDS